jgi:ABC-type antimicrobial peptide transport system permease subunit
VVGVVKDSGANLLSEPDSVEAYLPLEGLDWERACLMVLARSDPAPVARMVPSATAAVNETAVVMLRASRENLLQAQRKMSVLFGSIGALATALAAAGVFALVAFAVAQRRRELGIRMAIGATPRRIVGMLVARNTRPMAVGAVAGSILAVVLSRLVRGMIVLQHRDTVDVAGFVMGLACFAAAAALATLWPAIRALRIDPAQTLREE